MMGNSKLGGQNPVNLTKSYHPVNGLIIWIRYPKLKAGPEGIFLLAFSFGESILLAFIWKKLDRIIVTIQ